jgi:hypothetical protein
MNVLSCPSKVKSKGSAKSVASNTSAKPLSASFKSKIEDAIMKSMEPIPIAETKEITANKEKGIWANRCEVCTWKGDLPITEYPINEDACPEVITKKSCKKVEYCQEVAVRYLKPPAAPEPGPIIIKEESGKPPAPAPPIVIRQQPPRPCTPEPLVIREAPPCPPPCIPQQVIKISGKPLPAPPRKVVIERMAPMPPKPQPVIIERWMPYSEQKRRVIYQKAPPDPVVCKPKNIIVQWETPDVCIKKDIKHLGVVCANPCEYIQRYGSTLKKSADLPQFVKDIPPQCGVELAANKKQEPCPVFELCGDICALNLVDLEKEGLGMYKDQVREKCGCPDAPSPKCQPSPPASPCDESVSPPCSSKGSSSSSSPTSTSSRRSKRSRVSSSQSGKSSGNPPSPPCPSLTSSAAASSSAAPGSPNSPSKAGTQNATMSSSAGSSSGSASAAASVKVSASVSVEMASQRTPRDSDVSESPCSCPECRQYGNASSYEPKKQKPSANGSFLAVSASGSGRFGSNSQASHSSGSGSHYATSSASTSPSLYGSGSVTGTIASASTGGSASAYASGSIYGSGTASINFASGYRSNGYGRYANSVGGSLATTTLYGSFSSDLGYSISEGNCSNYSPLGYNY